MLMLSPTLSYARYTEWITMAGIEVIPSAPS